MVQDREQNRGVAGVVDRVIERDAFFDVHRPQCVEKLWTCHASGDGHLDVLSLDGRNEAGIHDPDVVSQHSEVDLPRKSCCHCQKQRWGWGGGKIGKIGKIGKVYTQRMGQDKL